MPIIKNLPPTVQSIKGEPIKLVCKVEGEPQPKVEWSKDNIPIKESENVHLGQTPDGTSILLIYSAKESDAGEYKLKASNPKGTTTAKSDIKVNRKNQYYTYLSILIKTLIYQQKYQKIQFSNKSCHRISQLVLENLLNYKHKFMEFHFLIFNGSNMEFHYNRVNMSKWIFNLMEQLH